MKTLAWIILITILLPLAAKAECVNKGPDKRFLEKITCAIQGAVSFRSFKKPVGIDAGGFFFLGWPPNVAFNLPIKPKKYLHGRLGFRWDVYPNTEPEKGCWYIGSAALKTMPTKLTYWRDKCAPPILPDPLTTPATTTTPNTTDGKMYMCDIASQCWEVVLPLGDDLSIITISH